MNSLLFYKTIGGSMRPTIKSGQFVCVEKVNTDELRRGDIVLYKTNEKQFIHRIVGVENTHFCIRDDAGTIEMERILHEEVIGRVVSVYNGLFGLILQRVFNFVYKTGRSLKYNIFSQK